MSNHIYVSSYSIRGTHYGRQSGYERFAGCHFEEKTESEQNIINKAIIQSVKYEPDSIYRDNDGYGGTCWCAEIIDSGADECITFYHFRNFENLVEMYNAKGYKFIQIN
jgi:hypothetical protein